MGPKSHTESSIVRVQGRSYRVLEDPAKVRSGDLYQIGTYEWFRMPSWAFGELVVLFGVVHRLVGGEKSDGRS